MAERQTQDSGFQPSEVNAIRMAVIEFLPADGREWEIWETHHYADERNPEWYRSRCGHLAGLFRNRMFRWRYGFLTLEPPDKCEIFRSE